MSDQSQAPTPAIPVIPSRAEPQPVVPITLSDAPQAPKAKRKPRKKKPELSTAEIKNLNTKRANAQKKKRKGGRTAAQIATKARAFAKAAAQDLQPAAPAVSHNRPLEMKTRVHAIIAMTAVLKKPELTVFSATLEALEKLSRGSRKRVIGALSQVYP